MMQNDSISILAVDLEVSPGANLEVVLFHAFTIANATGAPVKFEFSEVNVELNPGDGMIDVYERWKKEFDKINALRG